MQNNDFAMNRFSLRFADRELEAAFESDQAQKTLRPLRIAALVGVALSVLVWRTLDFVGQTYPNPTEHFALPALAIIASFAFTFGLTYSRAFLTHREICLLLLTCLYAGAITWTGALTPASTFAQFLIVIYALANCTLFRPRFPTAVVGGLLAAAIFLGVLFQIGLFNSGTLARFALRLGIAYVFGLVAAYQLDLFARREYTAMLQLGQERARSERLLLNILPVSIAERLKVSEASIADHCPEVTVLFADIVGFTPLSARKTPQALVALLDRVFSEFDALAETHGLEKIKTIGDAYMAAAGLLERRADHAQAAALMALGMLEAVRRISSETGEALAVRIGLHSGPVVAGVIGTKKFSYDMWGDTVNTASRMESHGVPGAVHCTEATAALLRPAFALAARDAMQIDGKGEMHTFLVDRENNRILVDLPESGNSPF